MIRCSRSWLWPWRWSLRLHGRRVGSIVKQHGSYVVQDLDGEALYVAPSLQESMRRLQVLSVFLS